MIATKTWREIRGMAIGYTLLLEIMLIPAILLFPRLRLARGAFEQLMPMQVLRDAMSWIADDDPDYAYRQYMAIQMFFKGTNIVGIAGAVLLATALVARERENGTLEFLLSRPVSRTRILLSKLGVVCIALVVPILLTSWSAIPLSWAIDHDLPFGAVTIAAMHASVFVVMFAALTCLCSVLAQTQAQAAFVVGGLIVVQVAIYFIQEIHVASVFRLSDPHFYNPIFEGKFGLGTVLLEHTIWPALGAIALGGLALLQFRRIEP